MYFVIYIIIILLGIEIYKTCFSSKLYFTSSKSNYMVMNDPNSKSNIGYAKEDVEYRIAYKNKNKELTFDYKYIKAPLNRFIAIYVKRIEDNKFETLISTNLVKITSVTAQMDDLFKKNNIFVDNNANYKYNIKFLSNNQYQNEVKKENDAKDLQRRYTLCINSNKKLMSISKATEKCSKEFKINVK